jgi:ABC-type nitrate/sulfonate/bicarbonate transport system permease component
MNPTVRLVLHRAALVALVLGLWQLAIVTGVFSANTLPTLPAFGDALVRTLPAPEYWLAIWQTMWCWAVGLAISVAIAVPVGLLAGSTPLAQRLTSPLIDFMRTIPSIILIPLAALLWGSTSTMKIVLIVFASVWPMLIQSAYGIRAVDPIARQTFAAYGMPWGDRVRFLYLPSASPYLATGLRLSAIMSLLVAIGVEIIGSAPGIGYQIGVRQANALVGASFVYLLTAAVLGLLITFVFTRIERRALRWHPSTREVAA